MSVTDAHMRRAGGMLWRRGAEEEPKIGQSPERPLSLAGWEVVAPTKRRGKTEDRLDGRHTGRDEDTRFATTIVLCQTGEECWSDLCQDEIHSDAL